MSQLSPTHGRERTGSSAPVSSAVASSPVVAGSVSMTPPPPEPPQQATPERRNTQAARAVELVDDELGPSLTSAQLMRGPRTESLLPDLSVSNEALLASLRPVAENTLGTRVSRAARSQGQRALHWFGTRPSWLQATLSVVGGSIVGLSLVVAYARAIHAPPEPEVAAEPASPSRGLALAAAAAPAALLAQRVVQPLAAAPAKAAVAPAQPAAGEAAAAPAAADTAEPDTAAAGGAEPVAADEEQGARKPGKRQRASQSSASAKLPAWVQQQVKPQVQRAAARERKAAQREKRAAALREKKARRARAKARAQE